jgi:hypothetical protein
MKFSLHAYVLKLWAQVGGGMLGMVDNLESGICLEEVDLWGNTLEGYTWLPTLLIFLFATLPASLSVLIPVSLSFCILSAITGTAMLHHIPTTMVFSFTSSPKSWRQLTMNH